MEEAIFLTRFASKVYVVHRRDKLRASKVMQDKAFANAKIEFVWNSVVEQIHDVDKGEVTGVVLRNLVTDELTELAVDGVFVAIGHTPNTSLFTGQLDMNATGYIVTSGTQDHGRRRVRLRRRAGLHLPAGDHGGGFRLHGGHGRRALPRTPRPHPAGRDDGIVVTGSRSTRRRPPRRRRRRRRPGPA